MVASTIPCPRFYYESLGHAVSASVSVRVGPHITNRLAKHKPDPYTHTCIHPYTHTRIYSCTHTQTQYLLTFGGGGNQEDGFVHQDLGNSVHAYWLEYCVCVCVCMYECMCVCMCLRVCMFVYACDSSFIHPSIHSS